ncbi:MAG: hydrolase 2, exosortase A system-associated [Betaproteobacteria bacterium]
MEAFYLEGKRRRFCLYHPPRGNCRGMIVGVHPFAEEMNRSRRMLALQARAFAATGFGVVQVDLSGCGDSSGNFGEAGWSAWVEDVVDACAWAKTRLRQPLWLWGVRAGALIAGEAASVIKDLTGMLLWQPVVAGNICLRQFLRLRLASDMLEGGAQASTAALEARLMQGQNVEVAGYALSPELAGGLTKATLFYSADLRHCICFEISSREEKQLTPAVAAWVEKARSAGGTIQATVVDGPAFWQTSEITECPSLISASIEALIGCSP